METPAGKDAADSAAAFLERGGFGVEAIDAVDAAIDRRFARTGTGSSGGSYATFKCIELDRDPGFANALRAFGKR